MMQSITIALQRFSFAALLVSAGASHAGVTEFECQSGAFWNESADIVVEAKIDDDGDSGIIEVADRRHITSYTVDGVNRQWVWEDKDEVYSHSFVLKPSNNAVYSKHLREKPEETMDSQIFVCRRI